MIYIISSHLAATFSSIENVNIYRSMFNNVTLEKYSIW